MCAEAILFWLSVLLLVYTYVGYPALVWVWVALREKRPRLQDITPTVSMVIVAYNEEDRIAARLENLLALDYPQDRLEIVFASDGSTDTTPVRARAFEGTNVSVLAFETRRGKAAVLNDVIPKTRGQIVVLTDVRQRFERQALRALVRAFADPQVGAVSGELILVPAHGHPAVGEGVGFYWRYEKFIRRNESRLDSTVGTTGAIYAIRRELIDPIPEDTILDDVLIPMRAVRRGYRVLFEPGARAYDLAAGTAEAEFTRKARTITGNFQLFAREGWLLNPFRNRIWFQTVSHKGLRLLGPVLHILAFGSNLALAGEPFYQRMLLAQVAFYVAALSGRVLQHTQKAIPCLTVPYTMCLLNWATMVGFFRFVVGRQQVTWEKAPWARREGYPEDQRAAAGDIEEGPVGEARGLS
jgi:cellulose synthase/poly-beta-1,6-N-acetylglucosamine synthase-like glycosyltransferase